MEGLGAGPRLSVSTVPYGTPCGLVSLCWGGLTSRRRERIPWLGVTTSGAWLALQDIHGEIMLWLLWPGDKSPNEESLMIKIMAILLLFIKIININHYY